MKIAIISSVLNEVNFIEGYILHNINYVDEILLSDGGSNDGTLDVIQKYIDKGYPIKLFHHKQGKPYTDEWHHDEILNNLKTKTDADIIMQIDADEILTPVFKHFRIIAELDKNILLYGFKLITFWENFNRIRVNVENDEHWLGCYKYCAFKNIPEIKFKGANHAILTYNDDNIFEYNYKHIDISLLHLHYVDFFNYKGLKPNDNRLQDVGGDYKNPDFNIKKSKWVDNPFNYCGEYDIKCIEGENLIDNLEKEITLNNLLAQIFFQYNETYKKLKYDNIYYINAINAYKEELDKRNNV